MPKKQEQDQINASPTKDFFISMLIRDITLKDAIGDLIDNSVDGALKIRPSKNYEGLKIQVNINPNNFTIKDNCGGIPYNVARDYAFRFGRDTNSPTTEGSVGQFGIGMKRAFFKIGKELHVISTSKRSSFSIYIDVDAWNAQPEWTLSFDNLRVLNEDQPDFPEDEIGTVIEISKLHKDIKNSFSLDSFLSDLKEEIELEHLANIDRGLKITINDIELNAHRLLLINNQDYKPAYWEKDFENGLSVKALVGVSESNLNYGGWYIFCNDRMVLGPEQTTISGWGEQKPTKIPKYHNQFDRFRGFVYFNADDPSLLPWNTSKNNMDLDSAYYKLVKQQMIILMRTVIDYLNKIHKENQNKKVSKPLSKTLENASSSELAVHEIFKQSNLLPETFTYPSIPFVKHPDDQEVEIKYLRKKEMVEKVMKFFGVNVPSKVGEKTFDYFYKNECEE